MSIESSLKRVYILKRSALDIGSSKFVFLSLYKSMFRYGCEALGFSNKANEESSIEIFLTSLSKTTHPRFYGIKCTWSIPFNN